MPKLASQWRLSLRVHLQRRGGNLSYKGTGVESCKGTQEALRMKPLLAILILCCVGCGQAPKPQIVPGCSADGILGPDGLTTAQRHLSDCVERESVPGKLDRDLYGCQQKYLEESWPAPPSAETPKGNTTKALDAMPCPQAGTLGYASTACPPQTPSAEKPKQ